MSDLKQTLRDGGERLLLRRSFQGEQEALDWLSEALSSGVLEELARQQVGEDGQLLRLSLSNDPVRGQRYTVDVQFVSREWRHRKRTEAGRATPPEGGEDL